MLNYASSMAYDKPFSVNGVTIPSLTGTYIIILEHGEKKSTEFFKGTTILAYFGIESI